jgi:hypothetical protein
MRSVKIPGGVMLVAEDGDPVRTAETPKEERDAVEALIDSLRSLKATIKTMPTGPVTLTRAQTVLIVKGLLLALKNDRSS